MRAPLSGHATSQGTLAYSHRLPLGIPARQLGRTGLYVSPVGFGCYRIEERNPGHRAALEKALLSGCNLIDTSTNYTNGSSERLVGAVLSDLISQGKLKREEIVIVTKAGYIQGENLELTQARSKEGNPFTEVVEYSPECWHSISPDFLEEQITRSLKRLGLERIDVLLLHNPEYFLKAGGEHAEYYQRIAKAFQHLESEVDRGRILSYGISSNSFPEPKEDAEYTSLETVWEFAESLGAHRFSVIQFPFNLFEPGAAFENNNSGLTVAEFARAKNLGTLVNRPLNAFMHGASARAMVRLASFPSHHDHDVEGELQNAFQTALEIETHYKGEKIAPISQVAWAHILQKNLERLSDLDTWRGILTYQIQPALGAALERLSHAEAEDMRTWAQEYKIAAERLFENYTRFLETKSSRISRLIQARVDEACPKLKENETLSQRAIRVVLSLPGITSVLVGMRRPEYVEDTLALREPLATEQVHDVLEAAYSNVFPG